MDKNILAEYAAMLDELEDMQKRITVLRERQKELKDERVADTVTGSREDLTIGPIKVTGKPTMAYALVGADLDRLLQHYKELQQEMSPLLLEVETFISQVRNSEMRTILRLRYIDRKTWGDIARRKGRSPDWCRKRVERYLKTC